MVLYTDAVDARDASRDGGVRLRRRQLGVGARDSCPIPHPADNLSQAAHVRAPIPGTVE